MSLSGRKGYLSLKDIGYGTGDGFGGWNCRHDWYPFFEGYSKPNYSEKDLQKLDEKNIEYNGKLYSQYEISQIQRRYEREIRAAKREQVAFKVAVDEAKDPELKQVMQDSLNYANDVVKNKQAKMRDFIRQTGQDRDYFREQNYARENPRNDLTSSSNSGKITSSKKKQSFRIPIINKTIENLQLVKPEGFTDENAVALQNAHKRLLKEARKHRLGTECAMIFDINMEQIGNIVLGKKESVRLPWCNEYHVALHNHPSGETFSIGDMMKFAQTDTMQALTALGNNGKVYILNKTISFDSNEFIRYIIESVNNKKIFEERTYRQLDTEFISTLTEEKKEELKKSLIQFSEELLEGAESYGAIYQK